MKRAFDLSVSCVLSLIALLPCLLIGICVRVNSKGPAIHWSKRVGRNNKIFLMPKFRSMVTETPQVATHLLQSSEIYITMVGSLLRRTSLDELPQLYSVLVGDMSFVGPRPALYNQNDLVDARTALGLHLLRPGVTGWAQINGRDELSIAEKVRFDKEYLDRRSFIFDLKILFLTAYKVFHADGIRH